MSATSLAKTNSEKITEMEDELSASLRDVIGGREEIDLATFTEDEILTLTSLSARISILASSRDMCGWIEEDEGGNQSSAWDILNALVDRGRLGHEDEVSVCIIPFFFPFLSHPADVSCLSTQLIFWARTFHGNIGG